MKEVKAPVTRRCGLFLIAVALVTSAAGCSWARNALHPDSHAITERDARKVHPWSHLADRHRVLTEEEAGTINRLYGRPAVTEGDLIAYYEASRRRNGPGERGNIFRVQAAGELGPIDLLVCTTGGRIDEIVIEHPPIRSGRPVVPDEFLRQFIGLSLGNTWQFVNVPTDLVTLPAKIKRIDDYPQMSETIPDAVRQVLALAKGLRIE